MCVCVTVYICARVCMLAFSFGQSMDPRTGATPARVLSAHRHTMLCPLHPCPLVQHSEDSCAMRPCCRSTYVCAALPVLVWVGAGGL